MWPVRFPAQMSWVDDSIEEDYETETGNQIIKAFEGISHLEVEMVLVACHGPFTWGATPEKALYNNAVLEEIDGFVSPSM